jgi:hypothetical protein
MEIVRADAGAEPAPLATFVILASIQLALRRLARAYVVDSTDQRFPMHEDQGRQIGL